MALAFPVTNHTASEEQHHHLFSLMEEFRDLANSSEEDNHSVSILFGVIVDYFSSHVSEETKSVHGRDCSENHAAFISNAKRLKVNIQDRRLGYKKLAATFLKNAVNTHLAKCA